MTYIKHESNTNELNKNLFYYYKTNLTNMKIERTKEEQSYLIEKTYKDISRKLAYRIATECKRAIKAKTESYKNSEEYKTDKASINETDLINYNKKISENFTEKIISGLLDDNDFLESTVKDLFGSPQLPKQESIKNNAIGCFEKILSEIEALVINNFPEQPLTLDRNTFLDYLVMDTYVHSSNLFDANENYIETAEFIKKTSYKELKVNSIRKKARILKDLPTIEKLFLKTSEIKPNKTCNANKYFLDFKLAELNVFLIETANVNPYRDPLRVYLSTNYCPKCSHYNSESKCKQCDRKHSMRSMTTFISNYIEFISSLQEKTIEDSCNNDELIVKNAVYYYFLSRVFDFENLLYITNKIIDLKEDTFEDLLIKNMSLSILIQDPYSKKKFVDDMFNAIKSKNKPRFPYKQLLKDKGVLATIGSNRSIMSDDFYDRLAHCRDCIMYNSTTIIPYMTACFYVLANKIYGKELAKKCKEYILLRKENYLNVKLPSEDQKDDSVLTSLSEIELNDRQKDILYKLYELIRVNTYNENSYENVERITSLITGVSRLYSAEYLNIVTAKRTFAFSNDSIENPASTFKHVSNNINQVLENVF